MAKSINHTTYNQSRKWHRNGIKKHQSQRYKSLTGVDPKILRNMHFVKKHNKKSLKKKQANNAKAMSTPAEDNKALVRPKKAKPVIPDGISCKLDQLTCITHPKLGNCAHNHVARILRLSQQRPKQRPKLSLKAPYLAQPPPKDAQALRKLPLTAFAYQCKSRRAVVTTGLLSAWD
uniref:60S ribosomal protein L29 n=1 Tax=Oryctolagus cuniculus TaxID=9986 RepID=G1THX9_RABIT